MTTSLTLTLERARDGRYRVRITPPAFADGPLTLDPSMFEAETLDEATSGLGDRLLAYFRAHREWTLPRTVDDAELGSILNRGTA